jgi:hypothetical protein
MVKQISWDDQWIGYDDADTIDGKVAFANEQCLGGTMIWSVDFDSGAGSGDIPDGRGSTSESEPGAESEPGSESNSGGIGTGSGMVYVDSSIWAQDKPEAQCEPPCVLVLPPIQLPALTTISIPPLTTSYFVQSTVEVGDITRTVLMTSKTTIPLPPITTKEIELWAVTIFSTDTKTAPFTAVQSVKPLSFTITLPGSVILPAISTPTEFTPVPTKPPVFFQSSHVVTIHPQPTFSIEIPPKPAITFKTGKPFPPCQNNCGRHSCEIFGCGGDCTLFGCGRTCGLFGCGGSCGLFGCGGGCGVFGCGGCGLGGCGTKCSDCGPSKSSGNPPGGIDRSEDDDNDDDDDDNNDDDENNDDDKNDDNNNDDENNDDNKNDDNNNDDDDDDDDDDICWVDEPTDSGNDNPTDSDNDNSTDSDNNNPTDSDSDNLSPSTEGEDGASESPCLPVGGETAFLFTRLLLSY